MDFLDKIARKKRKIDYSSDEGYDSPSDEPDNLPGENRYKFTPQVKSMLSDMILVPDDILYIIKKHGYKPTLPKTSGNYEGKGITLNDVKYMQRYPQPWMKDSAIRLDYYLHNSFPKKDLDQLKSIVDNIKIKLTSIDTSQFPQLTKLKACLLEFRGSQELEYYPNLKKNIDRLKKQFSEEFVPLDSGFKREPRDERSVRPDSLDEAIRSLYGSKNLLKNKTKNLLKKNHGKNKTKKRYKKEKQSK